MLTKYQAFSGQADGADKLWDSYSKQLGLDITFTHFVAKDCERIAPANLQIVDAAVKQACVELGKAVPTYSLNLIRRNYLIARAADKVFAVGAMLMADNGWAALQPYGGTSWGVQFAIMQQKPVVFFDQLKDVWWFWHVAFACWMPLEGIENAEQELLLTPRPALIGTRSLSKSGIAAIQEVLTKTKEKDETQT